MQNIFYENSEGIKLNLLRSPYRLQTADFFNYSWEYSSITGQMNGGKITKFKQGIKSKQATLGIMGRNEEEYYAAVDGFYETVERDVINLTPGKLWIGDYYLECYIFSSQKESWEDGIEVLDNTINIVTEYPFWISKNIYTFHSYGTSSSNNKRYVSRYPYRYANGMNNTYIINPHFTDSNFTLIVYGPVVNPKVSIGGQSYLVNIVLEAGEYLEIDSRAGTVVKVTINGERVDAFHNREKKRTFFKKIQTGRQNVVWTGKFDFDLILYEERSEPKWST